MSSPDPFNAQIINIPSSPPLRRRRKIRKKILLGLAIAIVVLTPAIWWFNHRGPVPQTQIFRGVTYTCERLNDPVGGEGLMHVVEVDLTAPGIELYVTPVNPEAMAKGWEYRVQYVSRVARSKA